LGAGGFNNNGKPDVIWQHRSPGLIGVWFMHGMTQVSGSLFTPGSVACDMTLIYEMMEASDYTYLWDN
jgi:hypothetical protein